MGCTFGKRQRHESVPRHGAEAANECRQPDQSQQERAALSLQSAGHSVAIIRWNSSSVMTGTPSCLALSSLLPASSPARTKSVFLLTLPLARPPCFWIAAWISSREKLFSAPVT